MRRIIFPLAIFACTALAACEALSLKQSFARAGKPVKAFIKRRTGNTVFSGADTVKPIARSAESLEVDRVVAGVNHNQKGRVEDTGEERGGEAEEAWVGPRCCNDEQEQRRHVITSVAIVMALVALYVAQNIRNPSACVAAVEDSLGVYDEEPLVYDQGLHTVEPPRGDDDTKLNEGEEEEEVTTAGVEEHHRAHAQCPNAEETHTDTHAHTLAHTLTTPKDASSPGTEGHTHTHTRTTDADAHTHTRLKVDKGHGASESVGDAKFALALIDTPTASTVTEHDGGDDAEDEDDDGAIGGEEEEGEMHVKDGGEGLACGKRLSSSLPLPLTRSCTGESVTDTYSTAPPSPSPSLSHTSDTSYVAEQEKQQPQAASMKMTSSVMLSSMPTSASAQLRASIAPPLPDMY